MSDFTDDIYGDLPPVGVGQDVPEFKMETYEPSSGSFGEINLTDLKKDGKWTILVFYPADFTFV
ncbi:MAG: redoxin domain-containing protein, partial [Limisphaerales bacterium]